MTPEITLTNDSNAVFSQDQAFAAGPSPQLITAWLLKFWMHYFSDIDNIRDPGLHHHHFLWHPDDLINEVISTGILITLNHLYNPRNVQQRPAIVIKRNASTPDYGLFGSINANRAGGTGLINDKNFNPNYQATIGQHTQLIAVRGSHTIYAVSASSSAAEMLGIELWHTLIDYMPFIRDDTFMTQLRVGELSPVQVLKEYHRNSVCAIELQYIYQRSTLQIHEAPLMKRAAVIALP